jgi:hypothetical protein
MTDTARLKKRARGKKYDTSAKGRERDKRYNETAGGRMSKSGRNLRYRNRNKLADMQFDPIARMKRPRGIALFEMVINS